MRITLGFAAAHKNAVPEGGTGTARGRKEWEEVFVCKYSR